MEIKVSNDDINFGYGTGCLVSKDGIILTNKHMIYNSLTDSFFSSVSTMLGCPGVKQHLANRIGFFDHYHPGSIYHEPHCFYGFHKV